jgi:hypothetical protein
MLDGQHDGLTSQSVNEMNGEANPSTETNSKPVSTEDLNKALTSYNKRLEKRYQDTITNLESRLESLASLLENNVKQPEKQESQANPNQPQNLELLKLQKQIEDLQVMNKKSEDEKKSAWERVKEEKIKTAVLQTLSSLKVEKSHQVYKLIQDSIVYDEANEKISLNVLDPSLGFEDTKDLKSGLTTWLEHEGPQFLPPKNISGSGATNIGSKNSKNGYSIQQLKNMSNKELANTNLTDHIDPEILNNLLNRNR